MMSEATSTRHLPPSGAPCPLCGVAARVAGRRAGEYDLHECPTCRFAFAPAALGAETDYDGLYVGHAYGDLQLASLRGAARPNDLGRHVTYRPFFAHVKPRPGALLLDVGCGVGQFCVAAQTLGWQVTGLDVSARAAEMARDSGCESVVAGTIEDLVRRGETFDVITAFEVLEHLGDPLRWLRDLGALLRPGATIFITTPNWDCVAVRHDERSAMTPPIHKTFFTQWALCSALARAEYEVRKTGLIHAPAPPRGGAQELRWLAGVATRGRRPAGLWAWAARGCYE